MVLDSSLPGEHGFHTRDGSLTKKKKEQWEKEKAESKSWFPFGSMTNRSSVRKSGTPKHNESFSPSNISATDYDSATFSLNNVQKDLNASRNNVQCAVSCSLQTSCAPLNTYTLPINQTRIQNSNSGCSITSTIASSSAQPIYPLLPATFPAPNVYGVGPYMAPIPVNPEDIYSEMIYPPNLYLQNCAQNDNYFWYKQQQQLQAIGAVTVASNAQTNGPLISPLAFPIAGGSFNSNNSSSFHLYEEFSKQQPNLNELEIRKESNYNATKKSDNKELSLDEQVAERKRLEEIYAERERLELERVKKIHEEHERRHQAETEEELHKQKLRQESVDAKEKAYKENIEKAKIESEVLRKAKLFKHVLLNVETTDETIARILGTNDLELTKKVLKEVSSLERQKRIDYENLHLSYVTPRSNETGGSIRSTTPTSTGNKSKLSNTPLSSGKKSSQLPQSSLTSRYDGNNHFDHDRTPLTRNTFTRASMRVSGSPKIAPVSQMKRRSGSAERANKCASTILTNNVTQKIKENWSEKVVANDIPAKCYSSDLHKNEIMPFNCTRPSPQAQRPVPLPRRKTMKPVQSLSSTSVNSQGTVVIENSTFASDVLPHALNDSPQKVESKSKSSLPLKSPPNLQNSGASEINNRSAAGKDLDSMRLSNDEEFSHSDAENNGMYNQPQLNPLTFGLRHFESLVSTFSPIIRNTTSSSATSAHNVALRYLTELPANDNMLCPETETAKNAEKHIGLFEPVKTRQKMRQDIYTNSCAQQPNFTSLADPTISNNMDYDRSNFESSHRLVKGFSAGTSIATSSESPDSSPISSSPPLSTGCKSNSPFDHSGLLVGNESKNRKHCNEPDMNDDSTESRSQTSNSHEDVQSGNGLYRFSNGRPPPTPFAMKLAANGSKRQIPDFLNQVDLLRRNLRSPTMMRLEESLNNLNLASGSTRTPSDKANPPSASGQVNDIESQSRPITPKPFNCRTMQYRSFNLKKNTERQQRILDQLASVRAQLKVRQENIERTFSNQNLSFKSHLSNGNCH